LALEVLKGAGTLSRTPHPIGQMPGLEIMGEAVSYGGFAPPESVRAALLNQLNEREVPGLFEAEMVEKMNEATREVLRRAFALYAAETEVRS
jgi:hypothetical protein